jgi:hypothetical protein
MSGEWIYFARFDLDNPGFFRMRTDGTNHEQLSDEDISDVNVIDDWIYFREGHFEAMETFGDWLLAPLARIRKDGTGFEYLDQFNRRENQ